MEKITAVIVDDELPAVENLRFKLQNACPEVDVVGAFSTSQEALTGIQRKKPQIVFMDIGLDTLSGFDLLQRLTHLHFEVIFTTTSRQHHLEALRAEAADYLSKPFTEDELALAVERAAVRIRKNIPPPKYLHIPGVGKDLIIPVGQILYCKAANNMTEVYVVGEKRYALAADTLKTIEGRLPSGQFYRIHRSHCVNRDFIKAILRESKLAVEMQDGAKLEIAQERKVEFYEWLGIV